VLKPLKQNANDLLLQDTFEDASDTTNTAALEPARDRSTERTRSLTNRSSSSIKSPALPESVSDSRPVSGLTDTAASAASETETETDVDGAPSEHNEDLEADAKQANSPLLTTHRLSTTSLHNINLEEDVAVPEDATPKGISYNFSPIPSN
jgi:hypothetical protein